MRSNSRLQASKPEVRTADKIRFLSGPEAYPDRPAAVEVVETHMSWLFFADAHVYKLKKPLASEYFDFTSLAAREANCRNEVRLNQRLGGDAYQGVSRLTCGADGRLALNGAGETVDWMVTMRRLPRERMLDRLIEQSRLKPQELEALGACLAAFYAGQPVAAVTPETYVGRFMREQAANRAVITAVGYDLAGYGALLDRLDTALAERGKLLEERVQASRIVDGHGDLRPEHICMTEPIVIFDCLEFSDALRQSDPVDELAFLGMECALLGAAWVGPKLTADVLARLGQHVSDDLVALYTAIRALLRARQSLSHLLDRIPRDPGKWRPLADRYAAAADTALAALGI